MGDDLELCAWGDGEPALVGMAVERDSRRRYGLCAAHVVKFMGVRWQDALPEMADARKVWVRFVAERVRLKRKPVFITYLDRPFDRLLVWLCLEWLEPQLPLLGCTATCEQQANGVWKIELRRGGQHG